MINMRIFRSIVGVLVFLFVALVGCGVPGASKSGLNGMTNMQLTPTMHTAFQLTPASERMPYPVPIEGVGVYEIEGLGSNSGGETAVDSNAAALGVELIEGKIPQGGLVEGELVNNAESLVVNRVVVITPLPRSVSSAGPNSSSGASSDSGDSQQQPSNTPLPPSENLSASEQTTAESAAVPVTPDSICGGSRLNEVGPAPKVDSMPIDFEEFGTWMRSESTYGAFLITSLLTKSGNQAAWVCYFFSTPEDEKAVFTQIHPVSGQPNTVSMWVNGNRSGHFLGVWILDNEQETWYVPLGPVLHEGWQEMAGTFAGPNAGEISYVSGPRNDRIDFPISFRGISINDAADDVITYGSVVIDDIVFVTR